MDVSRPRWGCLVLARKLAGLLMVMLAKAAGAQHSQSPVSAEFLTVMGRPYIKCPVSDIKFDADSPGGGKGPARRFFDNGDDAISLSTSPDFIAAAAASAFAL